MKALDHKTNVDTRVGESNRERRQDKKGQRQQERHNNAVEIIGQEYDRHDERAAKEVEATKEKLKEVQMRYNQKRTEVQGLQAKKQEQAMLTGTAAVSAHPGLYLGAGFAITPAV